MQKNSQDFSMREIQRLARDPAMRQVLDLLQNSDQACVHQAMEQASTGDYEQAKQTISSLLSSPEVASLLEQLGLGG